MQGIKQYRIYTGKGLVKDIAKRLAPHEGIKVTFEGISHVYVTVNGTWEDVRDGLTDVLDALADYQDTDITELEEAVPWMV